MQIPEYYNPVARDMAQALVDGFDKHYRLFRACNQQAKALFEQADWQGVQQAIRDRIQFYDERVLETVARLHHEFHADLLDDEIWQQAKLYFIGLLTNHKQPELAETFFNSVFTRMLHRDYFNNDFIFIRPAISTEYIESDPPCYRSYYPASRSMRAVMRRSFWILAGVDPLPICGTIWRCLCAVSLPFLMAIGLCRSQSANPGTVVCFLSQQDRLYFRQGDQWRHQLSVCRAGIARCGRRLYLDTVLLEPWRIGVLFSFSRAYFLVDMEVPSAYVQFLRSMLPSKTKAELYTMLGLQKQGKTPFTAISCSICSIPMTSSSLPRASVAW
jgi:isocitrate dehydrogenase kinase/phosphatase